MQKKKKIGFLLTLMVVILFPSVSVVASRQQSGEADWSATMTPDVTSAPMPTTTPAATLTPTLSPTSTPVVKKIKKVKEVTLTRYGTTSVKVSWKRNKSAYCYRVFYAKKKDGTYHQAGKTKSNRIIVHKLKNKKTYYFYVQACKKKKMTAEDSEPSTIKHMTMKPYSRETIFAGDSLTEEIAYGHLQDFRVGGKKKVVAYVGLNTITFHTKRVFAGRTALQKVIAERPYRVYMMLGMNEIHYLPTKTMIGEYRDMIDAIHQASPNTDIVLCGISPVTRAEQGRTPGYRMIPIFNKKLKKLAKKMGESYYGDWEFLKDSDGFLKPAYASADGYHWKPFVYAKYGKKITKFNQSLDK